MKVATDYDRICLQRKFYCNGGGSNIVLENYVKDEKKDEYIEHLEDYVVELEDKIRILKTPKRKLCTYCHQVFDDGIVHVCTGEPKCKDMA